MAGNLDEAVGTAKEKVGGITGNDDLEAEGKGQKLSGKVAQAADRVSDTVHEIADKVKGHHKDHDGT